MSERVDVVIVGGGIIGLAIARYLHLFGKRCLVVEKNARCFMETSSRNSEVLHSGIYYNQKSSKSYHCLQGRELLLHYLLERKIKHKMCGKLIVGRSEEEKMKLLHLLQNGRDVGLHKLQFLSDPGHISHYQNGLNCLYAIYSPYTGIIDTHSLSESLEYDITSSHNQTGDCSVIVTNCEFLEANLASSIQDQQSFNVLTSKGNILCSWVINCAGLHSSSVARRIIPLPRVSIPVLHYAKGSYFKLNQASKSIFNILVYPLPTEGGLGIHCTMDLSGKVKFGPDVEWLSPTIDFEGKSGISNFSYEVDPSREAFFRKDIASYWPSIEDHDLTPDYSGIRPKMSKTRATDFIIQTPLNHGVRGIINLYGIESPGLTSSLSIAQTVGKTVISSS